MNPGWMRPILYIPLIWGIAQGMVVSLAQAKEGEAIVIELREGKSLSEKMADFGEVGVGTNTVKTFLIKNAGQESVNLEALQWPQGEAWQKVGGTCRLPSTVLKNGETCTVQVNFSPNAEGSYEESLSLSYLLGKNGYYRETKINLAGQGTPRTFVEGRLHVEGKWIKDDLGNVVVLKGVNIADPQHLDTKQNERPGITARIVADNAVLNYKAKVIRLPILPGHPSYPTEGWFSPTHGREKYFANHVDPLVQYLTSLKVYVIIDLHYVEDYTGKLPAVSEFWNFMAPKYKDNPYVIYEVYNEPILPDNWNTWLTEIAQPAVNIIRGHAPSNLVIVGGPYWSAHMAGAATNPVVGTNILYTAHVYPNQSSSAWANNFGPLLNKYPVFVTEWGYSNLADADSTSRGTTSGFGVPFNNWMQTNGLSWTAWTFDNLWRPKMFDFNWNLLTGDNSMGGWVRDLLIQAPPPPPPTGEFVSKGASWKYLDNGSNQGTSWRSTTFNDSTWKTGLAELGYGDNDEATRVGYGSDANRKYVTTYFRHKFKVTNAAAVKSLLLSLLRDDGGVVYLNGQEVFRSNMPSGTIYYTTLASSDTSYEKTFHDKNISPLLLKEGDNVIAVEIHQAYRSSSDISFNFQLKGAY